MQFPQECAALCKKANPLKSRDAKITGLRGLCPITAGLPEPRVPLGACSCFFPAVVPGPDSASMPGERPVWPVVPCDCAYLVCLPGVVCLAGGGWRYSERIALPAPASAAGSTPGRWGSSRCAQVEGSICGPRQWYQRGGSTMDMAIPHPHGGLPLFQTDSGAMTSAGWRQSQRCH
jgi:hypothetical protein